MIEWIWAILFGLSIIFIVAAIRDSGPNGGGAIVAFYAGVPAALITGLGWLIAWLI